MIAAIFASIFAILAPAQAAPESTPLIIGETITLTALDEKRQINVILPADYHTATDKAWPVIYMLDGGMNQDLMLVTGLNSWNGLWERSQQAIIVGVQTKDRQRELLIPTSDPAEREQYPSAGESEAFRLWLSSTLQPLIQQKYRTNGTDILVGESAAGHFVVETWMNASSLFDGYGAISPSMQWSDQQLARQIDGNVNGLPPLFVSLADEGGATEEGVMTLIEAMDGNQDFCFSDRRNDLVHANSLHGLLPEALQYLLPTNVEWLSEYGLGLRCERSGQSSDQ
ncbi:alpha/beta hydrolase [Erythrobacter insulae]|uniref:Alpha/beta hydrolase n=2 Tax=Erythrobacter insulae TaxID=2584124 RepID=A0A547P7M2_9SPHN|nr:alpha/beta hydrolase [Erythrobacter insulae]